MLILILAEVAKKSGKPEIFYLFELRFMRILPKDFDGDILPKKVRMKKKILIASLAETRRSEYHHPRNGKVPHDAVNLFIPNSKKGLSNRFA